MGDKQAKIELEVGGASNARRAADDVGRAWSKAGKDIEAGWKNLRNTIAGGVESGVRDTARIALAVEAIDFGSAMQSAVAFRDSVTRMAVASGKDADSLRERFTAIGKEIVRKPEEVAAFSRSVARITYDVGKAADAARVLGKEGFFTDRSLDDMREFAVLLSRSTENVEDMERSVRKLRGEIKSMGVAGGDAAVFDWANASAGTLGKLSGTLTTGARGEAFALRAAAGQIPGLTPQEQNAGTDRLLQEMISNPRRFENVLSKKWGSITDETGKLKYSPIALVKGAQDYIRAKAGGDERTMRFMARNVLGPEGSAVMLGMDTDAATGVMNAPEAAPRAALDNAAINAARARNASYILQQEAAGKLADSGPVQWIQKKWGTDPAMMAGATYLAGKAGAPLVGKLAGGAMNLGARLVPALTGNPLTAPLVGAGLAGLAVGHGIDSSNLLSDRLAIMAGGGGWQSQGVYAHGIEKGIVNRSATALVGTPESIRTMAAQTGTTIERNVAAGYITQEEGDMRLAALEKQTRKSLKAAGVTGAEVDGKEEKQNAAENQQILADAMAQGWEQGMSRHPLSITILNYSGGPVQAVTGDKAYTPGQ